MHANSDKQQSWHEDNCVCGLCASLSLAGPRGSRCLASFERCCFSSLAMTAALLSFPPHACHGCLALLEMVLFFPPPSSSPPNPPTPLLLLFFSSNVFGNFFSSSSVFFLTRLIQWHEWKQPGKVNSGALEFCPIWVSTCSLPSRHLGASANTAIAALDDDDDEGDGEDEEDYSPLPLVQTVPREARSGRLFIPCHDTWLYKWDLSVCFIVNSTRPRLPGKERQGQGDYS